MFTQTKFATVQRIDNPVPLRHAKNDCSITQAYFRLYRSIKLTRNAPEAHKNIDYASRTLQKLGLLYEAEKAIRVFEDWCASPSEIFPVQGCLTTDTITRDEHEQILIGRILQLSEDLDDCIYLAESVLKKAPCELDFVHYDKEFKKFVWFHLAYDIADDRQLFEQWKESSETTARRLAAIASQYYGAEVRKIEIACIDPLLEWSRPDIGLWAIEDADLFTGKTGIAEEFTKWRGSFRKHQYELINNSTKFNEDDYASAISEGCKTS